MLDPDQPLTPHQQRLLEERLGLDLRIQNLETYSCSPYFPQKSHMEQQLVHRQLQSMHRYRRDLELRLDLSAQTS